MSNNASHGAVSWIQHSSPDAPKAQKFYQSVLGWNIVEMPMQDGSVYSGIMIGDSPIGGFSPTPSAQGQWLIFITVDNVDQRFNAAIEMGAKAISQPMSVPGVGRMATIEDPLGANIALFKGE